MGATAGGFSSRIDKTKAESPIRGNDRLDGEVRARTAREGELRPTFIAFEHEGHIKDDQLTAVARGSRREILKISPDAIFTEDKPTTLDGVKAMEFTCTKTTIVNGNKHPSKWLWVHALRNGNLYSLAFFAEPANYERALPQVREVMRSYK